MIVSSDIKINLSPAMKEINSDEFWLFGAHEWHRIYSDYVPHNTGMLRDKVTYRPKEIEHFMPYAQFIYHGIVMVDPKFGVGGFTNDGGVSWFSRPGVKKINSGRPLNLKNGSKEWDKKAKQDKKDLILIRSMQSWIDRNL